MGMEWRLVHAPKVPHPGFSRMPKKPCVSGLKGYYDSLVQA